TRPSPVPGLPSPCTWDPRMSCSTWMSSSLTDCQPRNSSRRWTAWSTQFARSIRKSGGSSSRSSDSFIVMVNRSGRPAARPNTKEFIMTMGDKLVVGALAGVGLAWGAREWVRSRRRITLENRVVIITGASTGHGLMVARYAAERGARLVLAARDSDDLRAAEAD